MATINGTSFADNLVGTSGADTINGRAGNDVIRGGGGRDTITLGSGNDTVVYTAVTDSPFASNWDLITDFVQGEDRIDLTALLGATDLTWGGLTPTANGVWYSRSGSTVSIFVDTNGAPGTPEMRIDLQNMSTSTVLTASDFTGVAVRTNAPPVITSQASWTVPENSATVGTVTATDTDSPTVTYSLVNGVDSARFAINPTTGALSFVFPPNFEAPVDVGANNVYNFTVQASDGTSSTTQAVTVTVTNVNEAAPVITSAAAFTMPENTTAAGTVTATDADNQTVTYSLVAGGDAAAFTINPTTGALSFVAAPNFEAPTDIGANNVYNLTVQASDGTLNTTQALAVTVTDVVNETPTGAAPVFTSPAAFTIAENSTAVGTVTATDADSPTVTYSLVAGGDAARFAINPTTGALSFVTAPDFEAPNDVGANNVYNFSVQASDGTLNTTQAVAVTVTNVVNETLTGDAAANTLVGAAGNDIITGNAGADTLTGNGGNDTFVYASAQDSPANTNWQTPPDSTVPRVWDAITDFTQGSDKIDLSAFLGATDLAWAGTTPTGNAVWYANSGTQTFIYVDIDNNPPPDVMIALQNRGSLTLTANDFIGVVGGFTGGAGAAPVFTSPATFTIPENSTAVGTVTATDADSPTVTYSLVTGVDSARFAINPTTGALSFVVAPNFEAPTDVGANNVYNLTVQASDGTLNTTQAIAVTVTNVNDVAPAFTSPAAFSIPENSTAVGTVAATDADSPTVTYSLVTGVDSALFAINSTTGALSFITAPNFEAPADVGANNVYNLTVQASDGTLNTTQAIAVTVTDVVNETPTGAAPVFTSPAAFTIAENSTAVGTVTATDADSPTVTYSLVAGGDAARFAINPTTGALSFVTAPDFEAPNDVGANNVYNFSVQASDGTLNTTQAVAVTVTNVVNETLTGDAAANTLVGAAGNDTITGNAGADTLTGNGGNDTFVYASAQDSPANTNWQTPPDSTVPRVWDAITDFTQGSDKIDLSAFLGATDLAWAGTTPTGNAVWYANSGTQTFIYVDIDNNPPPDVMIALQNRGSLTLTANDFIGVVGGFTGGAGAAPVFTSPATFTIPENSTAVGTVTATDADSPTVTYSLVTGVDSARFAINPTTGALSFVVAPNFEAPTDVGANNVYNLTVQASDGTLNTTQAIAVTVTNVNDVAPAFTSPAAFSIPENSTAVGTVAATDADSPTVTYSLVTGVDSALFAINSTTGALSFITAPNFEAPADVGANNVYNLTVQASDGTLNTTQAIAVTVTDVVNETPTGAAPVFTSPAAFTIAENSTAVGTVTATDADSPTVTYSLVAGGDAARFAINPTTGALSFVTAPDFEAPNDVGANNVYNFSVQASDGTLNTTQAVAVTVTNVVNETLTGDAAANTLVGAAGNDIITGNAGADTLTGNGGNDTFVYASAQDSPANTNWQTPPDSTVPRVWDAITDFTQGSDKIDLSAFLGATDLAWAGTTPTGNAVWYANSGTQTFIYVDIDNNPPPDVMIALQNRGSLTLTANDFIGVVGGFTGGAGAAPVFTSPAAFTIPENSTAVGTVTATDADSPTVTYSLVTGVDSALFAINPTTGALSFITAPNFEAPTDVGANNVYNLTVQASDGTLNTTQAIAVTVSDVVIEAITGTAGNDTLTGTTGADVFDIRAGGNDTVTAAAGADTILAGAAFNAADRIDGGSEIDDTNATDTLVLDGNYAAGVLFTATTLVNVEEIQLTAGNSYSLTTNDATVVAATLSIDGSALLAANTMTVNASAETEAASSYTLTGGAGNDVLTGGAGADYIDISFGGNDIVNGGAGRDTFYAGGALTAADQINGGAGTDIVYLNGDYSAGLTFGASTLTSIEGIVVQAGNNYSLTMNNAMLTGTQTASIDGFALGTGNTLSVNASAEADSGTVYTLSGGAGNDSLTGGAGNDLLNGNAGNDILVGGAGNDILTGGAGNDTMTGGLGNDIFDFNVVADRGTTGDTITDFSRSGANGVDVLNLHDLLLTFTGFNGANAFTGGYLQFDTSSGTSTVVRVDTNGGANSYVTLVTLTGTLLQQSDTPNYVL